MYRRLFYVLLFSLLFASFVEGATIHGSAYDSSFQTITNVQFEINTTPKQSHVSRNGLYFFFVPPGTYEIIAEKYFQKELIYSSLEIVEITSDGEFNIDIVLDRVSNTTIPDDDEDLGPSLPTLFFARYGRYIPAFIIGSIVVLGILSYFGYRFLRKKRKKSSSGQSFSLAMPESTEVVVSKTEEEAQKAPEEKKPDPVTDDYSGDLEGVLSAIKEEGGRTTQKDIRKKIPLSEAKISLMISELEAKGKLQKIKKGRGNIIILK